MEELKREAMCDRTELLLFDILQELKEIKELLKPKIEPAVEVQETIAEVKTEEVKEVVKKKPASQPKKRKTMAKKGKVKA
jgi:hypothetical protein